MRHNANIYNSSTWEAKDGESWIQDQLGICSVQWDPGSKLIDNNNNSHTNFLNSSP